MTWTDQHEAVSGTRVIVSPVDGTLACEVALNRRTLRQALAGGDACESARHVTGAPRRDET